MGGLEGTRASHGSHAHNELNQIMDHVVWIVCLLGIYNFALKRLSRAQNRFAVACHQLSDMLDSILIV